MKPLLATALHVAEGLAYAHAQGLIHRDVKPHNVLLDSDGRAYLADFGLLRTIYNDSIIEPGREGQLGTLAYMSPAVARGEAEDTRCDIYSFGAVLYEMLTGEPPYSGMTRDAIMNAILTGPPAPIRQRNPRASKTLSRVAEGCMARELRDRYASMADVLSDLSRISVGQAPRGPRRARRSFSKPLWRAVGIAASATLIVIAGWLILSKVTMRHSGKLDDARRFFVANSADSPAIIRARSELSAAPDDWRNWLNLADGLLRAERNADALEVAKRAHGLAPENGETLCLLGRIHQRRNELNEAARYLSQGVRVSPQSPQLWSELG